ncbi:MAG: NADP-dependent phosphogluconate dehydrogenase, partial [Desulfobacterales bacterium]|nr:NADP-dependent phosphogluconate dehydrogenase [Desulfobacterales bacterium]
VEARSLSSFKAEREAAAGVFPSPLGKVDGPPEAFVDDVEAALYAAKICSYAQGMALFRGADQAYGYGLDCGAIARIWRGGCIIRALFLNDIREAYAAQPDLTNLLLAPFFRDALLQGHAALRRVVAAAARTGIPAAAFSASLAYFDAYRCPRLPANLIQAQRDYFGAHTYQRVDREGVFHTEWAPPRK